MARHKQKKAQLKRGYGHDHRSIAKAIPLNELVNGAGAGLDFVAFDEEADEANGHLAPDGKEYDELSRLALTRAEDFRPDMLKYWKQRYMLFSLFDGSSPTGRLPLLDEEGWYSVTPEPIAARIAQRCRCSVVLDAFCGVGGNAIQFALTCERVIAIDTDETKLRLARHNARIYGVEGYITFLHGDWRDFAEAWRQWHGNFPEKQRTRSDRSRWQGCDELEIDVVFLSPPWGGVDYRTFSNPANGSAESASEADLPQRVKAGFYPLSFLKPSGGEDLLDQAQTISLNVCIYVPRNVDLRDLAALARRKDAVTNDETDDSHIVIDIEEQWLSGQCKALACYFGDLIGYTPEDGS